MNASSGCLFSFLTNTGYSIAKLEDRWEWYYLDDKGTSRKFDTTGAHVVYRILDVPKGPWYVGDDSQHPWVNALDLTIKGARTEGMTQFPHPIVRLTDFVFSESRLYYLNHEDIPFGRFNFRGTMNLTKFIEKQGNPAHANCQDCAGALWSMATLLGAPSAYVERSPFGFINATSLVGIPGLCNNPFFAMRLYSPNMLVHPDAVDEDDDGDGVPNEPEDGDGILSRSCFSMHAFMIADGRVYDATAGPHRGVGEDEYLRLSIDTSTEKEKDKAKDGENLPIHLKLR